MIYMDIDPENHFREERDTKYGRNSIFMRYTDRKSWGYDPQGG